MNSDTCASMFAVFLVLGLPAILMLSVGTYSTLWGLNTGGVGTLLDLVVESFERCQGKIAFFTDTWQKIEAHVLLPCSTAWNGTRLPIDICYNYDRPQLVAYNDKTDKSACSFTGHNEAHRLSLAGFCFFTFYVLVMLYFFVEWNAVASFFNRKYVRLASVESRSLTSDYVNNTV